MRRTEDSPSQCGEVDDHGKDSTLKAVIDSLDTPIFSLDTAYRYTSFNKAHAEMMKALYGKDVETGASLLECMTVEADRAVAKTQLDRTLRGERTVEEARSGEEPQSRRYFEVIQTPIKGAGGRVVGASILVRDITDRKRMEVSLSESEAKYRSLFDSAGDSIFIHDEQGRILAANRVACEQLGYTLAELMGMTAFQVVSPEETRHVPDRIARLKAQGHLFFESVHCRKDGSSVPTEVSVRLVKWDGKAAVMSICRDISERKKAEEALRKLNSELEKALAHANGMAAKAEEANRAKSEFLATMSHEFRTPLNAIIGFTGLTLESTITDKQRSHLEIVRKRSQDLLGIIQDILDLVKIEAEKMEFADEELAVGRIIDEAVETLDVDAKAKGISLLTVIDPNIPGILKGDSLRLKQILINFIGNAVKFTECGTVAVRAALTRPDVCAPGKPAMATVLFSVEDTGIGIPADKLEMIFEAFSRVDNSSARKFDGTGLGLAICRRLVNRMGGRIWAESVVGKGSTFYFVIPFNGADRVGRDSLAAGESGRSLTPTSSRHVLVVEDDQMSALLIQEMLAPLDIKWWCAIQAVMRLPWPRVSPSTSL